MNEAEQKTGERTRSTVPTVSESLLDGRLIELLYRQHEGRTALAVYDAGRWALQPHVDLDGVRLIPFSPGNNLIKNEAVLLPSEPRTYGSEEERLNDIRAFIHRYVDLSPTFEKVAMYYVLLSWLYDAFNELPYLRLRGDFGTGKTRALLVIGSICYKPFFASGASTVSPIFHTLEAFRGTLVYRPYRPTGLRASATSLWGSSGTTMALLARSRGRLCVISLAPWLPTLGKRDRRT